MNRFLALLATLCCTLPTFSQSPQWTWVAGPNLAGQPGSFGTKGVPAASNNPGDRYGAATWTAKDGTLWIFGAGGNYSNDLWKYDPNTGLWTWISGENTSVSPGNYGPIGVPSTAWSPAGRMSAAHWTDQQGNFWLFGGSTTDFDAPVSDLWMFNPTTNEWTLEAGTSAVNQPATYGTQGVPSTSNIPPSLTRATCFTDHNGIFWLYGGYSQQGVGDDLWKFDPALKQWTWVHGTHTIAHYPIFPAVWGTQKVPSPANTPGPRIDATGWVDNNNNLWLFGAAAGWDFLNDLWKYDPYTDQWTWINGSTAFFAPGIYGTKGVTAPGNVPGCRYGATSFPTNDGKLWLFGGLGMGSDPDASHSDELNDLWCYDIATDRWTWMAGETTVDAVGIYGTKGASDPRNEPGARIWASGWTDKSGRLWLFGGGGYASQPRIDETNNDLWGYFPSLKIIMGPVAPLSFCPGATLSISYTLFGAFPADNVFTLQLSDASGDFANPIDIGKLTSATDGTITAIIPADIPPGTGYRLRIVSSIAAVVSADNGADIYLYGKPNLTILAGAPTKDICPGTSIPLSVYIVGGSFPLSFQWSTGEANHSIQFTPTADTTLQVTGMDGCSAIVVDSIRLTLYQERAFQLTGNPTLCPNSVNTLHAGGGYNTYLWQDGSTDSTLAVSTAGDYSVTVTDQCGKPFSGAITVTRDNPPTGFLPADTAICSYDDLSIIPRGAYNAYAWSTGETTRSITVSTAGVYTLRIADEYGCPSADTIVVENKDCFMGFRMPTAFTPNGDGHNDHLRPHLFGRVVFMHLTIFNRFGAKVFETTDPAAGWDGTSPSGDKATGTYVWTCEYQFAGDPRRFEKGTVLVIR